MCCIAWLKNCLHEWSFVSKFVGKKSLREIVIIASMRFSLWKRSNVHSKSIYFLKQYVLYDKIDINWQQWEERPDLKMKLHIEKRLTNVEVGDPSMSSSTFSNAFIPFYESTYKTRFSQLRQITHCHFFLVRGEFFEGGGTGRRRWRFSSCEFGIFLRIFVVENIGQLLKLHFSYDENKKYEWKVWF